jgi:anthranilate synthase component II
MSPFKTKILILDHFDSFTYNLFRLVEPLVSLPVSVVRYDLLKENDIRSSDKIILSPGPGVPSDYPRARELLTQYGPVKPFLGICLGNQAIAETFGGRIFNLPGVFHGVKGVISWTDPDEYLFKGLPPSWSAGLYHSWAVDRSALPPDLRVTAISEDGILMALRHDRYDIRGVQFHPESYMTAEGTHILKNWLRGQ